MALSVDGREEQQMMIDRVAEEYGATVDFTLLGDPDNAVIDRYGVFNPDSRPPVPSDQANTVIAQGTRPRNALRVKFP